MPCTRRSTKILLLSLNVAFGGANALAQPTLVIEDLTTEPQVVSTRYVGLDVKLGTLDGSEWITGGLYAKTANGAEFVYAADPNGVVRLTEPDDNGTPVADADKFLTFVSKPRVKDGDNRFLAQGAPAINGEFWCPGAGVAIDPTEVNVSYSNPAGDPDETNARYIARVVLDLSGADLDPTTPAIDPIATGDVYVISGSISAGDQCDAGLTLLAPTNANDVLLAYGVAGAGTNADPFAQVNSVAWAIYVAPKTELIFILDGSGSVAEELWEQEVAGVADCLCGPFAFVPTDGTVAITVMQLDQTQFCENPNPELNCPPEVHISRRVITSANIASTCDDITALCDAQNGEGTHLARALDEAFDIMETDAVGSNRIVYALNDGPVVQPDISTTEAAARDLRSMEIPVKICSSLVGSDCSDPNTGFLENLANTVDASTYEPNQPAGLFTCMMFAADLGPLCTDCSCNEANPNDSDSDGDGIKDLCEIDCNANDVPDEDEGADGAIVFVDTDATGDNTGANWDHAYTNLQFALRAAACKTQNLSDVQIWVAEGTYVPTDPNNDPTIACVDPVNEPNSPTFRLPRNVAVYGGFNGTETDFDDRDVTNNVTTLSGDVLGDDPNNPDDNVVRIVSIIRVSGVVLDGFTITGSGDAISDDAVFIEVADARIANCTFEGNEARSVTLSQSNSVTLRMDDCTFTGNSAESLFVAGGRILGLFRCSFTNNTEVPIQGGGTMTLIDCDFTGNQSGTAGAIDFRDASGTLDIWNSRFLSNGGSHGAIGGNESSVDYTVVNSLFAHNGPGGALQTLGSLTLDNCTFARNFHSSDNQPGGVSSAGPATVSNCIFWQNCNDAGDPNGCDPNSAGQGEQTNLAYDPNVVVVNYTCIQGLSAGFFGGTGNIGGTPSTTTMFVAPGPSNLDFHLDPNSPCIDAGDNARLPADVLDVDGDGNTSETLQIDLDRNSRIHNGTVDMGAFEFRVACGSGCGSGGGGDADFNDDCAVNITDLGIMLTNFGKVGAIHAEGDANLDGIINITDVGIALSLFGATCSP